MTMLKERFLHTKTVAAPSILIFKIRAMLDGHSTYTPHAILSIRADKKKISNYRASVVSRKIINANKVSLQSESDSSNERNRNNC